MVKFFFYHTFYKYDYFFNNCFNEIIASIKVCIVSYYIIIPYRNNYDS